MQQTDGMLPGMSADIERFRFIGHALAGDGPFRPRVVSAGLNNLSLMGETALVQYQRESVQKFARRNQVAFYASPMARACARFVGYLFGRAPVRDIPHQLYEVMTADIDGKGTGLDVWLGGFATHLKARGSMLLLVDMPGALPETRAAQIQQRRVPVWTWVAPESLTDYAIGEDGKFDFAEFAGMWTQGEKQVACTWHFDRSGWSAVDKDKVTLGEGDHPLGECPLLIATEGGDFPHFGPFAAIADIARRLFNMDSELDEILRGQTFSLLTMAIADSATNAQKVEAAKLAGETIGTANMLVHTGATPTFIAPPSGPAEVYIQRINDLRAQIDEIALTPRESGQRESGEAMRFRFAAVNGELARFAGRLEDIERRAWALSQRWLGLSIVPTCTWSRDYNVADVAAELQTLRDMRDAGMPREVLVEQMRRIVAVQFAGMSDDEKQRMVDAIDAQLQEVEPSPGGGASNVVSLPDRNSGVREAIVRALTPEVMHG